jgi:aminoglycoside phosphotransferase
VLRLARRHTPVSEVTAVDETGGEARAYVIDETLIFKTQRPHRVRPRTSLEKEVFHLNQLQRCAPEVNVPRVLGYGREDDIEYTLMTRMPGVPLRELTVTGQKRADLLAQLGAALRQMHALDAEPFRQSGLFPGDTDVSATRERLAAELERGVEAANEHRSEWTLPLSPEEAAAHVRQGLSRVDEAPVPLHSNPGPEHVFVNPSTLHLEGVIDFGDAYLSHPALDFRRWAQPDDRRALMVGYAEGRQLSNSFEANWLAISVAMLMQDFANRPSRRTQSLEGLERLLV